MCQEVLHSPACEKEVNPVFGSTASTSFSAKHEPPSKSGWILLVGSHTPLRPCFFFFYFFTMVLGLRGHFKTRVLLLLPSPERSKPWLRIPGDLEGLKRPGRFQARRPMVQRHRADLGKGSESFPRFCACHRDFWRFRSVGERRGMRGAGHVRLGSVVSRAVA